MRLISTVPVIPGSPRTAIRGEGLTGKSSSPDGGCRRAGFPIGRCAAVGNDKGNRSGGFWMRRLAHNLRRGPKFSYLNRP